MFRVGAYCGHEGRVLQMLCLGDHLLSLGNDQKVMVWKIGEYEEPEVSHSTSCPPSFEQRVDLLGSPLQWGTVSAGPVYLSLRESRSCSYACGGRCPSWAAAGTQAALCRSTAMQDARFPKQYL